MIETSSWSLDTNSYIVTMALPQTEPPDHGQLLALSTDRSLDPRPIKVPSTLVFALSTEQEHHVASGRRKAFSSKASPVSYGICLHGGHPRKRLSTTRTLLVRPIPTTKTTSMGVVTPTEAKPVIVARLFLILLPALLLPLLVLELKAVISL